MFQNEKITIPIKTTPFTNIQPNIIIENEEVVKKENNFLTAKKVGSTKVYLDTKIGQGTMRLISNIKVKEGKINEEQINNSVRKILNLKKRKLLGSKNSQDFLGSETHKQVIEKMKSSQR